MHKFLKTISCLLVLNVSSAQDTDYLKKSPIAIKPLKGEIILDGVSNEDAWKQATSFPFIVIDPVWGQAPSEKTELFVTHDKAYLYVAGRCYTKDSSTIVARNLIRDNWRGDDWMTIHIDSRYDKQNAFVFSVYPLGSYQDMATSNDAVPLGSSAVNNAFNMLWKVKTVMNAEGWFFEMKIPLYNLRFKANPNGEIIMGMSSTRGIQYIQEFHHFPAVPQNVEDNIMKPSIKNPVLFTGIEKQKLFLLTPYLRASRNSDTKFDPLTGFNKQKINKADWGVDAKVGVSSYLTLDLAYNPDFSQAEADNQILNLSRFSVFFPERRLFFQEQSGLFDLGLGGSSQLFYSRRIGINQGSLTDIYAGARLTGKLSSDLDIGLLTMRTAPVELSDGKRLSSDQYSVLRLRKKFFNDRSFIGFLSTLRNGNASTNLALGVDGLINTNANHYVTFGLSSSLDQNASKQYRPNLLSSRFMTTWENRKADGFFHRVTYIYSGKDFNPEIGFVDRTNFHHLSAALNYGKFAKQRNKRFQYSKFTLLQLDIYKNLTSSQWETIEASTAINLRTFKSNSFSGSFTYSNERLTTPLDFGNNIQVPAGNYHFMTFTLGFSNGKFRKTQLPVKLSMGSFFDGFRTNANLSPTFNINKHWEVTTTYDFTYLTFKQLKIAQPLHIARVQLNYAMNLHLSLNLITQYNSSSNQLLNNLRIRYNFKDGHDMYLIWNESRFTDNATINGFTRPGVATASFLFKYYYTFENLSIKKLRAGKTSSKGK